MELDLSIRELLKLFLMPPSSLLFLLLFGLIFYRRTIGKLAAWLGLSLLYFSAIPATTHWLASPLETYPAINTSQLQETEAILVLSAGRSLFNPELNDEARVSAMTASRLAYAVHLHRQSNLPIIVSGGLIDGDKKALSELAAEWLREQAQIEPLALETKSLSTWQNAEFSASLLADKGIRKVALVTHSFHMQRAMQSMQEHNIDAIAAPFDFVEKQIPADYEYEAWKDWVPNSSFIYPNYLLLHEHIGTIWYRLKQ